MLSSVPCSRPSKGVKPVRRSDEHLPSSKAAPRPSGVGAKKPGGPSSVASRGGGGAGKVIDSRSKAGVGPRKNTPTAPSARKPVSKKEAGNKVGISTSSPASSIDGFHGAFYHGNWKALHHHAAC